MRKMMRPVFHSSELIPFETRELDPVVALPPRDGADNADLLPEEEQELEHALRVPRDNPAGNQHQHSGVDQDFGVVFNRMEPQWISTLAMQHSPNGISTAFRLTTRVWSTAFRPLPSRRFG